MNKQEASDLHYYRRKCQISMEWGSSKKCAAVMWQETFIMKWLFKLQEKTFCWWMGCWQGEHLKMCSLLNRVQCVCQWVWINSILVIEEVSRCFLQLIFLLCMNLGPLCYCFPDWVVIKTASYKDKILGNPPIEGPVGCSLCRTYTME